MHTLPTSISVAETNALLTVMRQRTACLTIKCHPLQKEVDANSLVVCFSEVIL